MKNVLLGIIVILLASILGLGIYSYIQFQDFKKETKKNIKALTGEAKELREDLHYFVLKYEDDIVEGLKEESKELKGKALEYADSLRIKTADYLNGLKIKE